jgi:OmpA-OmpF porin, OOP family
MGSGSPPTLVVELMCRGWTALIRLALSGSISIFALVPLSSDAGAQYYIGTQAGWTGLPYQTDMIDGLGPVPVQFNAGYNVGARGGYQLASWRFEQEYSYRRNNVAAYGVEGDSTNRVSGNRHTHSIMTNVLYDFSAGWPVTPHIGVGIGAMDVFDSLKIPSRRLFFNDNSWQFAYQGIAGLRYEINPVLALDLDYRYLATTESTFRIPNTALHYRTGANTNNFVASLTYRFGALLPDPASTPGPTVP